ncbi:hypothetical protein AAW00_02610 [Aurantiacibacter luteus]|uniref:Inositolphosphotransferase Aur1/Ipt1 domain-containing protein n=2 Tax=Aurantiacibacter luteus TaxID=1581420 RepID=A0A0G9MX91_9SPHN|nr:hypothetical protein AAW00_02610 [Aurantiacibacter luteus]
MDIRNVASAVWLQALLLVWLVLIGVAVLFMQIARKRARHPARTMLRTIRCNRARFLEGSVFLVALALMMQIYMVLKVAMPTIVPFYADPLFARIDAAIFGQDPWRISHMLLGPGATRFLDGFYTTPCLVVTMGMTLWACFSRDRAFSRRAVLAITLSWFVIGVWAATLLSSAGPAYMQHFYGEPRFAALTASLPADLTAVRTQAYLLENFGAPGFGKGISAMPSMHNALYLLLIWMMHDRFGNAWQTWCAVAFEATVFVASVHLGWHYALDGIVSALMVGPIWWMAGAIERLPTPRWPGVTGWAGKRQPA